jgi:DNA invertase Pin-like site-specific DNA recombinase
MAKLLGYARVSTLEQNVALQHDALWAAGCWRVFTDHVSGAKEDRPELGRVLEQLRDGDTLVVWRLDRLGRSLRHLIDTVTELAERGVGFRSTTESIDTTTSGGRLVFHVFGALAQFERELARERTLAGLKAARARGRMGGRPALMTAAKTTAARRMYEQQELTVEQIARALGVSRSTIYRALNRSGRPPTRANGEPV